MAAAYAFCHCDCWLKSEYDFGFNFIDESVQCQINDIEPSSQLQGRGNQRRRRRRCCCRTHNPTMTGSMVGGGGGGSGDDGRTNARGSEREYIYIYISNHPMSHCARRRVAETVRQQQQQSLCHSTTWKIQKRMHLLVQKLSVQPCDVRQHTQFSSR